MAAGFHHECAEQNRVAANIGMTLSAVYAVLILPVYFAQTTTVRAENINKQALRLPDYRRGGLLFNYDLPGYGIMALSAFFIGLSVNAERKADKWLKYLMMIHGVFFLSCFIMPMNGIFTGMSDGGSGKGGTIISKKCGKCGNHLRLPPCTVYSFHLPRIRTLFYNNSIYQKTKS